MLAIPIPAPQCKLDRLASAKSSAQVSTLPRGVLGWPENIVFLHNRPKSYPVSPKLCSGHPVHSPSSSTPINPKLLRKALLTSHQTRVASWGDSPSASASSRCILDCNVAPIPDGPELRFVVSNPTNCFHSALPPSPVAPRANVGFYVHQFVLNRPGKKRK